MARLQELLAGLKGLRPKRPAWLKMPQTWYGQFLYGFADQFLYYFVVCANFRAVAIGLKAATFGTDVLITMQAFVSKKLCVDKEEARTWWVGAGETFGGGLGSILSIILTKKVFGQ